MICAKKQRRSGPLKKNLQLAKTLEKAAAGSWRKSQEGKG
jgi:hypothetical protein